MRTKDKLNWTRIFNYNYSLTERELDFKMRIRILEAIQDFLWSNDDWEWEIGKEERYVRLI